MKLMLNAISVGALSAISTGLMAQEHAMPSVHSLAKSMKLGIEYRAGLEFNDNKYTETDDVDADSTTDIVQKRFKIRLKGDLTENADFYFRYDALNNETDYAKVTWWMTKMFGVTVGQDKVKQNGWENYRETYDTLMVSPYQASGNAVHAPFAHYSPSVSLHAKVAGTISVQLLNDVIVPTAAADADEEEAEALALAEDERSPGWFNKTQKQPATIIEWLGEFGPVSPLVQVGLYDLNHSMFFSIAGQFQTKTVDASATITQDMRKVKIAGEEEDYNITSVAIDGSFRAGAVRPFGKLTYFDVKQPEDDAKENSAVGVYDDNAMKLLVGVFFMEQDTLLQPYAALQYESGKFVEGTDDSESKSQMGLHIGIAGSI